MSGLRPVVLGIDSSTTACKAIAFDPDGRVVAEGRAPVSLENPEPDGWEQDAERWWAALCEACRLLAGALDVTRIVAASIAHQRETFVVTDAAGRPLHPAIVWMDKRSVGAVARAVERLGADALHSLSGKPACTTPSLYKLMHLFASRPELPPKLGRVLDVHAFSVWRLTGRLVTSLASADPMGLVDMRSRRWSEPLLDLAGITAAELPELCEPGAEIGRVSRRAAAETGLPEGLPVVAGAGDGQAAGLGAGIVAPGAAYLNLGTAVVSGTVDPAYRCDRAFRTLYAASPGGYLLETDLQGGCFTLDWLVERLLGGRFAALGPALETEAEKLPVGSDGLLLVPYWNGVMSPYWDDTASGIVTGLRGHHGRAHLYRAVLEGIACEQRLGTEAVERATGCRIAELVAMGGGSRSALWCSILADVLGKPIVRAGSVETSALGAAILAAVAAGLHPDVAAAARAMTTRAERFEPGPDQGRYAELFAHYRELYPAVRAAGEAATGRVTPVTATGGPPSRRFVASRRVVLGGGDEPLRIGPALVAIEGPTIAAVSPLTAERYSVDVDSLAGPAAELLDAGDRLVAPAFVNAHTHLALGCLRGGDVVGAARGNVVEELFFERERRLGPEDIRAFARMGAYDSLLSGVGLVWDHYYAADEVAAALADVGLGGVVAPTLQDLAGPGTAALEQQLAATERIDADGQLRNKGIVAAFGPHATDTVSEALLRRVLERARSLDLPVHAHLAQSVEEHGRATERHGLSPIGWLAAVGALAAGVPLLLAHVLYASRAELARLAAAGATVAFCPFSQLVFGFPARVDVFSEVGLRWVVATDCSASNDTVDVQQELRLVAGMRSVAASWSTAYDELLRGGAAAQAVWAERQRRFDGFAPAATPEALLGRVWSLPGALHPKLRAGVLAPGALANLLVIDLDHPSLWPASDPLQVLAMAAVAPAIWAMLVAGRLVGVPGDFHGSILRSPEHAEARREARARLTRLGLCG